MPMALHSLWRVGAETALRLGTVRREKVCVGGAQRGPGRARASSWGQTILRSLDCIVPNGVEESGCLLSENSPAVGRVQAGRCVEGGWDNPVGDGRV